MKIMIISFTGKGIALSKKISKAMEGIEHELYTKCSYPDREETQVQQVSGHVGEWTKEQLERGNALLFIGACGIAVRAVAPHITDKLHDSPVLVTDESGQYVIPLLSGHVGGANELAVYLAERIGAEPVITTATDIRNRFAIDLFAGKNGLTIVNKDGIAKVTARVLAGEPVFMSIEPGHWDANGKVPGELRLTEYPPKQRVDVVVTSEKKEFDTCLLLVPKEYAIGIGCKKNTPAEKTESFIAQHLQRAGIDSGQVFGMASIDRKRDEPGLVAWSRKEHIPFCTYTAEELNSVNGMFHPSVFVKEHIGVDNVCERAAMKLCGPGGVLRYEKHAEDGMTIAIASREWSVHFDEK